MGACNFLSLQFILFIQDILQPCESSSCIGIWTTKTPKLLLEKNLCASCKYRAENIQILDFIEQCLNVLELFLWCFVSIFTSLLCKSVAIIKSDKDRRYELDSIVTHDGAKLPCLALSDMN